MLSQGHNGESGWSKDADDFIEVAEKREQCLFFNKKKKKLNKQWGKMKQQEANSITTKRGVFNPSHVHRH